jgi:ligand-binding SRPBCC domain-containing protein
MRLTPTVGLVADGTETLEPAPVTKQDALVTEREQICANREQWVGRIGARAAAGRQNARVSTVRISTDLPISAETAFALAQKPELFEFVVAPILRVRRMRLPDRLAPGVEGSARLWWFGVVPSWTHHLRIVRVGDNEIYTDEHGGPVRTWKHRLTFEPLSATSCRYTDEIETEPGLRGLGTRVFARLMFRHRHRRWRLLARLLRVE